MPALGDEPGVGAIHLGAQHSSSELVVHDMNEECFRVHLLREQGGALHGSIGSRREIGCTQYLSFWHGSGNRGSLPIFMHTCTDLHVMPPL